MPGWMRYTRTANQFGGTGRGNNVGNPSSLSPTSAHGAVVVAVGGVGAPCDYKLGDQCIGAFNYVDVAPLAAPGGAFGVVVTTSGAAPVPGVFLVEATAGGFVASVGPWLGTLGVMSGAALPGFTNRPTSYGGPFTTGKIEVRATQTGDGGSEMFTLTGSDSRVNGLGNISLVSGGVSDRTVSKPNANRGWANFTVTSAVPEPAAVAATASMLIVLAGCHRFVRRRAR
ncbi:MAG: hypothetical protein JRG92_13240 [Deltaproteobacteria bacterium]|nr:hypothetical protein [Deltaproteobacteria bacterium]MBW2384597.1 hypothetical protein [Deltaproteobacteria bacterium]MBW2698237.1 hypothetical protein [Deltaproteobacteria bacterium]